MAKKKQTEKNDAYEWSAEKMACVATYRVLEGEEFRDQFEDADIPFEKAAGVAMGRMRYFPALVNDPTGIRLIASQFARRFITDVVRTFTVEQEDPDADARELLTDLTDVFSNEEGTIVAVAEIVDDFIRFPGEKK